MGGRSGRTYEVSSAPGRGPVGIAITVALCFPRGAAGSATFGPIGEALESVELLLTGGESKGGPAFGTLDEFALISHWMSPSLGTESQSSGYPMLR